MSAPRPQLRPRMREFLKLLSGCWQVVVGGPRASVVLPGDGPYSNDAVIVVFDRKSTMEASVVVVPAGVTNVTRAGSMPLGADAVARLNALSKVRPTLVFGLRPAPGDKGPIAAFQWEKQAEMHIRLAHFNFDPHRDAVRCFTPQTVVFRHFDWMLEHCGVDATALDADSLVVPVLGPLLSVCPGAVGAIPRGSNDPESELRLSRLDAGWRVPRAVLQRGLAARAARWLAPELMRLYFQYCNNPDLERPFRRDKRRATELAERAELPKCFARWFKGIPPSGLKHEHRMVFARFANSTGDPARVCAIAEQDRPDLAPQLKEAKKFQRMTTAGCDDARAGRYAHVGLVCDCVPPTPASAGPSPFPPSPCPAPEPKKAHFAFPG